jgi:murein DD-endopeptidase MepM/ murein hydrolase activator NlpD
MSSSAVYPRRRIETGPHVANAVGVRSAPRALAAPLAIMASLLLAGCSADISRFDFPSFALNDSSNAPPRPIGGVGAKGLGEQPAEAPSGNGAYFPPRASAPAPAGEVRMSSLPEPMPAAGAAPSIPPAAAPDLRRPASTGLPTRSTPPPMTTPVLPQKGEQIEVTQGDTLYGLSKKHKVSIAELMTVNDLKSPALKPGQKLHLPAGRRTVGQAPHRPLPRAEPVAVTPAAPVPAVATNWSGSYTVKSGDSLYAIALQHKVKLAELQSANGIADARKVRPGTVIKVPGSGDGPAQVAQAPQPTQFAPPQNTLAAPAAATPPSIAEPAPRSAGGPQPTIINAPERVAAVTPAGISSDARPEAQVAPVTQPTAKVEKTTVAAAPVGAPPGGKLRWPVKGKIIAPFGPRSDGTHNDGVNLSVPLGTDVHAAEAGVVAYAGSELKGYGNLILVRHDNGWVTAYAHNDQLLVKRGDKIKRGQVVAKAGKTGTIDQPQVHFELRQGSKPIDPMPFMEKL